MPQPKAGELPMIEQHQKQVLGLAEPPKRATIRTKPFEPGIYKMVTKRGVSLGHVRVVEAVQISRTELSDEEYEQLITDEGYPGKRAEFERLVRFFYKGFLDGKPHWKHVLEPAAEPAP